MSDLSLCERCGTPTTPNGACACLTRRAHVAPPPSEPAVTRSDNRPAPQPDHSIDAPSNTLDTLTSLADPTVPWQHTGGPATGQVEPENTPTEITLEIDTPVELAPNNPRLAAEALRPVTLLVPRRSPSTQGTLKLACRGQTRQIRQQKIENRTTFVVEGLPYQNAGEIHRRLKTKGLGSFVVDPEVVPRLPKHAQQKAKQLSIWGGLAVAIIAAAALARLYSS